MTRWGTGLLLAAHLTSGSLAGQTPPLEARIPPAVWSAVQPVLESARRDSLPVLALEAKVLEGVAKDVEATRIAAVARQLADELRSARSVLRSALPGVGLDDGEVTAAATAIRQGVPPEQLVRLWDRRAAESLEIPIAVVGELTRRGIEPDAAVDLMSHVLESGTALSTAAKLPARLDIHLSREAAPGAALVEALRSLGIPAPPRRSGRGPGL